MSGIPNSFIVVAMFAVLAVGLIVYFLSRQFLFRYYKRKGEEEFQRSDYLAAVRSFARAEALWDFNATKQTTPSYERDLATLDELLSRLELAARTAGIALALDEYRDAVNAVRVEFQGRALGERASAGKTYASAFMRLKEAQSELRKQLRACGRPSVTPGRSW